MSPSASAPLQIKKIPHPKKVAKDEDKMILHYKLEEVVGYGAWGKVKKGVDRNANDRKVAIKILRKKRISRKIRDGINKIYKEFELLNGLDHESIVKYYDLIETNYDEGKEDDKSRDEYSESTTCTADSSKSNESHSTTSSLASYSSAGMKDGKIYLVMEWLGDGCNLTSWIAATKSDRSIDKIREILRKLLQGLDYLAEKEIAHHDIKLDNVIYNEADGSVKIIDFGVSEACPRDESFCAFGTPAYQAPEILLRTDPSQPLSGHKMDIWSLGVVAYQLANPEGKLPFEGDSVMQVFDGIINGKPDYSLLFNDDELKDLIRKMLKKNPKTRLTASEALKHSFFTRERATLSFVDNLLHSIKKSINTGMSIFKH